MPENGLADDGCRALGGRGGGGAATTTVPPRRLSLDMTVLREPAVRLGHHTTRDTQFGGEQTGGRESAAHGQAAVGDRLPQLPCEPVGLAVRGYVVSA